MNYPLLAAIAVSMGIIVLLWRGDPKRRRIAGLPNMHHGPTIRRLLVAAALLPGVGLALSGDTAAFLIWLGSGVVGGWLITQWRT
jgi:hypothetical protein